MPFFLEIQALQFRSRSASIQEFNGIFSRREAVLTTKRNASRTEKILDSRRREKLLITKRYWTHDEKILDSQQRGTFPWA
jgi:hypothetical protein